MKGVRKLHSNELDGKRFHRLTVIKFVGKAKNGRSFLWKCLCDCGKIREVYEENLKNGNTKSCGCYRQKHGKARSRVYRIWEAMIQRCTNPRSTSFYKYGARGISVCERWRSFPEFLEDMGEPPPRHTIDRFPNGDGNYEPGNCRWATYAQQNRNIRTNVVIEAFGKRMILTDWSKELGITSVGLAYRLRHSDPSLSFERRLTECPKRGKAK